MALRLLPHWIEGRWLAAGNSEHSRIYFDFTNNQVSQTEIEPTKIAHKHLKLVKLIHTIDKHDWHQQFYFQAESFDQIWLDH